MSKWKCDLANLKQWVNISIFLLSYFIRSNVTINNITMISVNHAINYVTMVKQSLNVINETIRM